MTLQTCRRWEFEPLVIEWPFDCCYQDLSMKHSSQDPEIELG
jgi:hypothetical protein